MAYQRNIYQGRKLSKMSTQEVSSAYDKLKALGPKRNPDESKIFFDLKKEQTARKQVRDTSPGAGAARIAESRAQKAREPAKEPALVELSRTPMEEPEPIRLGGTQEGDPIDLRTAKIEEAKNPLDTLLDLKIASSPLLQALTSPLTTAALAASLAVMGGGIALAPVALKLTTPTALAIATKATYGTAVAYNAKTAVLSAGILAKAGVSAKAIALFGGWAGAVWWGQWGQAEGIEALSITMRDVMREAEKTGDWSLYDEAKDARNEILDLKLWEKIALWSPGAPFIGIPNKIKGAAKAALIMDKLAKDKQNFSGEGDDEKWERIRQEQDDSEKGMIDFYNDERKKMVEWEREAKTDARDDDASFWRKERKKQDDLEKQSTKENADFWTNYRKESIKLDEEAAQRSADFWLDYQRKKQEIIPDYGGGGGGGGGGGAPGTTRTYMPGSQLGFGLLKGGGGYKTEEEEKKKKKKK